MLNVQKLWHLFSSGHTSNINRTFECYITFQNMTRWKAIVLEEGVKMGGGGGRLSASECMLPSEWDLN